MGFAIAGAAVGGALIASQASQGAANTQANAAGQASQLSQDQYDQTRADQAPWRMAGASALGQMQDPSFQKDFSMADFQKDPGYDFRMAEGQKAIERSAAARGGLNSGATLKSLTNYSQGVASDEYGKAYDRFNNNATNRYNRLASVAGLGQTAMNNTNAAGAQNAATVGNNIMGAANASSAAQIAGANATNSAIGSAGNTWMNYQMMNRMMPEE